MLVEEEFEVESFRFRIRGGESSMLHYTELYVAYSLPDQNSAGYVLMWTIEEPEGLWRTLAGRGVTPLLQSRVVSNI